MASATLNWFMKHSNDDAVRCNVLVTYENGDVAGKDFALSDAALTANAQGAAGKLNQALVIGAGVPGVTWAEPDICALATAALGYAVTMPPVPVVEAVPANEVAPAAPAQ